MEVDKNDKRTPWWFFEQCQARYGRFLVDVAAHQENHLCRVWLGPGSPSGEDALDTAQRWGPSNWCNPPYGPVGTIPKWIQRTRYERDVFGARTLMLLPADTSTVWFADVERYEQIELVRFRLAFTASDGSTKGNSAKFGSVLVHIAPRIRRPE